MPKALIERFSKLTCHNHFLAAVPVSSLNYFFCHLALLPRLDMYPIVISQMYSNLLENERSKSGRKLSLVII